jgi:hypothetical protein
MRGFLYLTWFYNTIYEIPIVKVSVGLSSGKDNAAAGAMLPLQPRHQSLVVTC